MAVLNNLLISRAHSMSNITYSCNLNIMNNILNSYIASNISYSFLLVNDGNRVGIILLIYLITVCFLLCLKYICILTINKPPTHECIVRIHTLFCLKIERERESARARKTEDEDRGWTTGTLSSATMAPV